VDKPAANGVKGFNHEKDTDCYYKEADNRLQKVPVLYGYAVITEYKAVECKRKTGKVNSAQENPDKRQQNIVSK